MSTPSDLGRAREIARKTGLPNRFESADANWSTDAEPRIAEMPRLHIWHAGPGFTVGTYRGRYFVFAHRGEGRFTFLECGASRKVHDFAERTSRHLNFFQHHCYLTAAPLGDVVKST